MVTKSICAIALAFGLFCTTAHALGDDGLKVTIDSAIQNAVQQVLQSVGSIGDQTHNNLAQASQAINAAAQASNAASNNFFQQAADGYRNLNQNIRQGYQNVNQQILNTVGNLGGQVSVYDAQLSTILDAYETSFCLPAKFTPSIKKPAKFTGPFFELTLDGGYCAFNETALIYDNIKELNCVEPSIILTKLPANFTSKYKTSPKFASKECKVQKVFGEVSQKVLYVFDGQQPVDINAIAGTVLNEIRGALGTVTGNVGSTLGSQMQRFLSSNPLLNLTPPQRQKSGLFNIPNLNIPSFNLFPNVGSFGAASTANTGNTATGTASRT